MKRNFSRAVATVLLAAMIPFSTACFGSFNLTRQLYKFNREVSNDKWIRWIVFLGMAVFPVYAAGFVVDGLFGNSVEFWGGRSPFAMAPGTTREIAGTDGSVLRVTTLEAGVVRLELRDAAGTTHRLHVTQEGDGLVATDADGRILGRVSDLAGTPQLELAAAP